MAEVGIFLLGIVKIVVLRVFMKINISMLYVLLIIDLFSFYDFFFNN